MKWLSLLICLLIYNGGFGQSKNGLIVISEIMYDSPLNERIATGAPYSNGEYIELFNLDRDDCDLSGWKMSGGGVTENFIFPEGTTIPGKGCLLLAYQYKDSGFVLSDLYEERVPDSTYCKVVYQRKIILSNQGESICLYDNNGNLRDKIYYDGTSNKSKPDRLHAGNEDDNPGPLCISLHRSDVRYDGRALCPEVSSADWYTEEVSPGTVSGKVFQADYFMTFQGNYIRSITFASEDRADFSDRIDYFDGLGYLEQTVDHAFTPTGGDRITLYEYDGGGNIIKQWLPAVYAEGTGRNDMPEVLKIKIQKDLQDEKPFMETKFDALSMQRKTHEFLPGKIFSENNRYKEYRYELNGYENVIKFTVSDSGDELTATGYYRIGRLIETTSFDEHRRMTITYTDVGGKVVLVRQLFEGEPLDTYFVFDDRDRLRWVTTPKASEQLQIGQTYTSDSSLAQKLCYLYWYDARGNIVRKRLPGRGDEMFIYDKYGRLASRYLKSTRSSARVDSLGVPLSGTLTRSANYYLEYYYDDFNRVEQEVIRTIGVEIISKSYVKAIYRYGGTLYPEDVKFGSPIYVDDVGQGEKKLFEIPSYLAFEPIDGVISEEEVDKNNRGFKIYEKLIVMDSTFDSSNPNVVERAFYYDRKGRVVQTVEKNHLGGICRFSNKFDLIGKKLAASESVRAPGIVPVEKKVSYIYDRYGRLLAERVSVDTNPMVSVNYDYNDRGQLVRKIFSSGATSITDTLHYNLQGWLTERNYRMKDADLFRSKLRYYDSTIHNYSRRFNGDISEWEWQHGDDSSKTYVFAYDGLNRLDNALLYHEGSKLPDKAFTESFSYDMNGNIFYLTRYGQSPDTPEASYTMHYDGNRLLKVSSDAEKSFEYDGHGNLTYDYLRDLHITYNYFDLVENVTRNDSIITKYTYLWDGTKLSVRDGQGDGYEYLGSWIYRRQGDSLRLESIPFSGGRFVCDVSADSLRLMPHFYLTDHLGSVRVVVDGSGNVTERNDYYPFGKRWEHADALLSDNRFVYNGKELQVAGGLGWLDYGARMYDSDLARWLKLDPMAEAYYLTSPYVFCANNPLRFIDTDGRSIKDILWGIFVGAFTNITGDNSLREEYIPDNADHYNSSLHAADVGTFALGATSFISGGAEFIGGAAAGVLGTVGTGGMAASLAVPAGAAISAHGATLVGTGMMLMKNAGSNLGKAYNYKGPEPNQGGGKPHGGTDHNNAIDKKIQELSKQDNIQNIRKNQQQVDANGNRMGNNRPDIQWDQDGIHHNLEVDRNVRNNVKHERIIRKNDPEAIYEKEILH